MHLTMPTYQRFVRDIQMWVMRWLGQQDSNLHNWYQKPGSYHWTMAQ
jgi:hypothetical protein